jgi:putative flippase GtrA
MTGNKNKITSEDKTDIRDNRINTISEINDNIDTSIINNADNKDNVIIKDDVICEFIQPKDNDINANRQKNCDDINAMLNKCDDFEIKSQPIDNDNKEKVQSKGKKEFLRTLKYLFFAASAGLIQVVSLTILNEVIFKEKFYWPCYLVALILSVIWNFTFNRRYTFKSANNVPKAMLKVIAYYCVFTPLSTCWGEALTSIKWNEYLVLGLTMFINLLTEFTFCRFVVFRNSIDTNTLAKKDEKDGNQK